MKPQLKPNVINKKILHNWLIQFNNGNIKGTVSAISSESSFKEGTSRFTTVPSMKA